MKGAEPKEKPKRGQPVKRTMPEPTPETAENISKTPKGGRPSKPIQKIDATPEEIARRIFENAKPPDPSIRVRNKPD